MNYLNYNPFELAAKLILQRNARIRDFVSNVSKVNTLIHAGQLYKQIEYYQRIASLASCCPPSYDRDQIFERCNHGINDCYNELDRLKREALRDEVIERCVDMRR